MDTDLAFKIGRTSGIARKRGELERLMNSDGATTTPPARRGQRRLARCGACGMRGECDPSFRRRTSGASEQDPRDLKVSNKEGHA
jgi:hypothetical protein